MTRYLVVPQWQGSPSSRAMQLIDGAEAIAGDLPRGATSMLEVPMEAGETLDTGIHRFSALQRVRDQVADALAPVREPVLVVGGDCGVALPAIAHAATHAPGLAVVWFDAHPDFHTPHSSSSGAFAGMVLRAALGEGDPSLALDPGRIDPARVVVAGARSIDDGELAALDASGVTTVSVDELRDPATIADAVRRSGAESVYIHVDVDVLDPAQLAGNAHPEPFGASVSELTAAIAAIRSVGRLVGSSLTGYSPASVASATDDLGAILRIVGALA